MDRAKVLFLDDEPTNLKMFELLFERFFDVVTAVRPKDAMEMLRADQEIELVISDFGMPEMNGLEFIDAMKEECPEKRFFLLTGYAISEEMMNRKEDGSIEDCFTKPFDIGLVVEALKEALNDE